MHRQTNDRFQTLVTGLFGHQISVLWRVKTSRRICLFRLPRALFGGLLVASILLAFGLSSVSLAHAQTLDSSTVTQNDSLSGGSIDSLTGGIPRPRRGAYIIDAYPSPASLGETIVIQYYNHNAAVTMLRVVDFLDRSVSTDPFPLQSQQLVPNGLHRFTLSTSTLAAGVYFIRLTTYTSTGDIDQVQDSRFMIVR